LTRCHLDPHRTAVGAAALREAAELGRLGDSTIYHFLEEPFVWSDRWFVLRNSTLNLL